MRRLLFAVLLFLAAGPARADNLGDRLVGSTIYGWFTTPSQTGLATLSGGSLAVYKDGSNVESTCGITLQLDLDGTTGFHNYALDTSCDGTFYAAGGQYSLKIAAGTVDGQTRVGYTVDTFCLQCSGFLRPTTTGRTLDVSAGGEAGVDWANVGSPTTTLNLSGTTISAVSGAVGSVTGNVGGNVTGSVGSVTGNVGGNVTGSVGSVAADGITASSIAADAIGASEIAADALGSSELAAGAVTEIAAGLTIPTVGQIADAVWDEPTPHNTASTMGNLLTSAGGASDPLLNAVPGSYGSGTAGFALGRLTTTPTISIRSPIGPDGSVEIVKGDSYTQAEATALEFTVGTKTWPADLSGYTVTIVIDKDDGTALLTDTLSVVTATGSGRKVRWEPTATETNVTAGRYKYEIKATKGSEVKRLELGQILIREGTT